uniref:RING-type E3 ubiquitin transferase n=1 Tax=Arundo donax TaxID=35708 RepID=A0A0A9CVQ0_ARUDO
MAPPPANPSHHPLLFLSLLLLLLIPAAASSSLSTFSYATHCPALPAARDLTDGDGSAPVLDARLPILQLSTGYFSGGGARLFGSEPTALPRSFSLLSSSVLRTTNASLLHVSATLTVSGGRRPFGGRNLFEYDGQAHRFRPRLPRFTGRRGSVTFGLEGYYSPASGELCMVGTGSGRAADGSPVHFLPVVLRVGFPNPANLTRSFVTGCLESVDSLSPLEPVSLVAYAEEGYAYAESASCPPPPAGRLDALQVFEGRNFSCAYLNSMLKVPFRLDYGSGSDLTASSLGLHQRYMYMNRMHCADDGAVRAYVVFTNHTEASMYYFMLGEKTVVAEGFWDQKSSRLCLKGCHVVNSGPSRADLAVGECGIGMSFWFPAVWSIQQRSFAAGLVWNASLKSGEAIAAGSSAITPNFRGGNLAGLKYNYTKVDDAKKYYEKSGLNKRRKGKFPDSNSYRDLVFRFYVQKGGGSGYASPVTIGSMLFDGNSLVVPDPFSHHARAEMKQRLINVSYDIYYVGNWSLESFHRRHMSAEGVYDAKTGCLCMIACREVNVSSDCEILVTAQFSSLDAKVAQHVKGTIKSLREKADPLFFETLDIASYGMYIDQVDESIWRMDLESIMALISMTLACIFIAVQLFHVKKVPDALPAMSITMLVVLALGYMIPLVLNFEALFKNSNKQTVPLSGGGWLEVNEVMMRIITMLTFLLQLRLLQLAWSARSVDASKVESWAAERKVLWICLPLYLIGGVITWVVHMRFNHGRRMLRQVVHIKPVGHAFWEDLVSYGGLILDGFLLPQVIINVFSDSKVRALSPGFYIGSTLIRALPHVYDAFRTQRFVLSLRPSYMYASPHDDLFSLAWDIVIPCGAILLSVALFFQQRLGGAFFLCWKNMKMSEYEMVSTVLNKD